MQAFKIPSPAWIKYLQLHLFTHHGGEAVCALNDVLVYGKSAADDLEDQLAMEAPVETQLPAQSEPSLPPAQSQADSGLPPHSGQPPAMQPPPAAPDSSSSSRQDVSSDSPGNASALHEGLTGPALVQLTPAAGPAQQPEPGQAGSHTQSSNQAASPLGNPPAVAPIPGIPPAPHPPPKEPSHPSDPTPTSELSSSMPASSQPIIISPDTGPPGEAEVLDSDSLLLMASQGSKGRPGSSVFDLVVTELRGLKLQQKSLSRSFAALEQNMSAAVEALGHALGTLALDVSMLER